VTGQPRIPPLAPSERDAATNELLAMVGDFGELNVFTTLVRNPRVFKRWVPFGNTLLNGSLPPRDRELVILRVAHRCDCVYEWHHHTRIARDAGLDDDEIARVRIGAGDAGWHAADAVLLRAVDELLDDHRIGDATWEVLAARYDERLLIELLLLVGQYQMLAAALNSLGVEVDGEN
jgi:AhpD family alkylhydroperoxidase